jgi:predicted O-methyltransferase YrrM
MSSQTHGLSDELRNYLHSVSLRDTDVQRRLREATAPLAMARMQISPEQGQFFQLLIELTGARRCIEVGVFTGYSALCVAMALPPEGKLIACDVSDEWTSIGRPFWEEAGVAGKIDLRLAPAVETLDALLAQGQAGSFDFAFIDADKSNYDAYYERLLQLLRPGGLIAIDNVLWGGRVIDPEAQDEDTVALRALNQKIHGDQRVTVSMVPIGDGLTLARKRA